MFELCDSQHTHPSAFHINTAIPKAITPAKVMASETPTAGIAPELDLVLPPVEVVVPFEALVVPAVPPLAPPDGARLTVALAANCWKFSKERVELAAVFSLMTMTMPDWQCLP